MRCPFERARGAGVLVLAAWAAGGCEDRGETPEETEADRPTQEALTFAEFEETLATGTRRVEIELVPGTLVAREVEVHDDEALDDQEEIESRVAAIDVLNGEAVLTLAVGGIRVPFDRFTALRRRVDEGLFFIEREPFLDGDVFVVGPEPLTFDEFVDRVRLDLALGVGPIVSVRRDPFPPPAAPDPTVFVPLVIDLESDLAEEATLEVNVPPGALDVAADPPPLATLQALALPIAVVEDTDLELPDERALDFAGFVAAVDADAGILVLEEGPLVRLVPETEIDPGAEPAIETLDRLEDLLALAETVRVEGEAIVTDLEPSTLTAAEVRFELAEPGEPP